QPAVFGSAYDVKVRTVLSGGVPPDVMRINDDFVRGFSEQGTLTDLSRYIERDGLETSEFATEPFEFARQPDGSLTAWVIGYQPRLIFYNVDLFEAEGVRRPPTTWSAQGWGMDDFVAAARALTIEGERYGGLIYLDTGYEQTFTTNHGHASGIFSEDGTRFTLADPLATEALQWAVDLTCRHHVQPPWSQLQQDNADSQMFAQGRLAMLYGTFDLVPYFRDTITDFTWDVAPPPADVHQRTEASVVVFAVAKSARNKNRAWELLKFLASEEGGTIFANAGAFIPIHNKAAELLVPDDRSPAHLDLFVEAADHLVATNQTRNALAARQLYRPALDAAYNCERSVADVLADIKEPVQA